MDLHDGIIQAIYGVGLSLESALHSFEDDPQDAKTRVQRSIESLRIRQFEIYAVIFWTYDRVRWGMKA